MKPYIGITGITSAAESSQVAKQFLVAGFSQCEERMGMLGYYITGSMMNGAPPPSPRYLLPHDLPSILAPDCLFGIHVLHFLPLPGDDNRCVAHMAELLLNSGVYANGCCRTIQINYATQTISPNALAKLKPLMPDLEIILQVGRNDFAEGSPAELVVRLAPFVPFSSLFLIDPSQGQGRSFDREVVQPHVNAIQRTYPHMALGFAGGLSADNVGSRIKEFASLTYGAFSIDVESGVRDQDDRLNLERSPVQLTSLSIPEQYVQVKNENFSRTLTG